MAVTIDGSTGVNYADNIKQKYGTGGDLEIYHDGSTSYIDDAGTGILRIRGNEIRLCNTSNETYFTGTENGSASLYHNDVKKFETLSTGVRAQGGICFGSDTAAANHLDDYEEGEFTPAIGTSSGSAALRTANDTLAYTKIGDTVHIVGQIVIGTCSSPSGAFWMTGLPFTSGNGTDLAKRTSVVGFGWFNGSGVGNGNNRYFWESFLNEGSTSLDNIQVMHNSYVPDETAANLLADGTDIWMDFTYKI